MAIKTQAILVLAVVLSACSASESSAPRAITPTDAEVEAYNARVTPDKRIVCRNEKPVGTYIPRRVCRLQGNIDETSNLHRSELRRVLQ